MLQRGSSAPTVPLAQRAHERREKRRGWPSSELSVPSAGDQRARCWVVALTWKSARTLREKKQQTSSRARALRERDKPNQPHSRDNGPMSGP